MTSITESAVRQALEGVMDPELHKNLIELGMVREVGIDQGQVNITLVLATLACPFKDELAAEVKAAVGGLDGVERDALS